MSDNQDSGLVVFAYFYGLTQNLEECYGSLCHVTTRSIKKFESFFSTYFDDYKCYIS